MLGSRPKLATGPIRKASLFSHGSRAVIHKLQAFSKLSLLGFMLYDMDYSNKEDIQPMFFRAVMKRGVIDLRDCEVIR